MSSTLVRFRQPQRLCTLLMYLDHTVHRSVFGQQQHPKFLQPFLPELRTFSEHNHFNVLHPVLKYD